MILTHLRFFFFTPTSATATGFWLMRMRRRLASDD